MIDDENISYRTLLNSKYSSRRLFGSSSTLMCRCSAIPSVFCALYVVPDSNLKVRNLCQPPKRLESGVKESVFLSLSLSFIYFFFTVSC